MAKKPKAVYAPGELNRVRGKLGELDAEEAKRMAQILGGEVGYERNEEQDNSKKKRPVKTRHETVELVVGGKGKNSGRGTGSRPKHRVDLIDLDEHEEKALKRSLPQNKKGDPADDPSVQLKTVYFERVKMDRYAAQPEFDIKTGSQALLSMLSFFSDPPDYVNALFVNKRMNEYYRRIEQLVTSTRTLFPRNNTKRSEKLKRTSPFVFSILDTIRYWNIERITGDLAKIQAHPRTAKTTEFSDILRAVYKPLFILEQLDADIHIKGAYKLLYKILYIENPMEAKDKYQGLIRTALTSFSDIKRDVRFLLYPLLMKLLSDRWLPYERFFIDRRNRIMAFLNVTDGDRISPAAMTAQQAENGDVESGPVEEIKANETGEKGPEPDQAEDEDSSDPEVIERKARRAAQEAEQKALARGLNTLETLFPKAGWDRLSTYPDLFPYFTDMFSMKRGYELIAPTDPLLQAAVLMHVLEELFFALRYVTFGAVTGSDGNPSRVDDYLGSIINSWQRYIDVSLEKEYLPRLVEYCHILENSAESRTSVYAKRTLNELHWAKRLYFLPYYKFESIGPPPFQKGDTTPIYGEIRLLRKYLTAVAVGIEQGTRRGGAEALAPCDGIDNPWEPYNFEVPNPVSMRLDALLGPKKRTNASLIFYTLAVTTVLDYLVNNENSWAYENRPGPLFRSVDGEGYMPLFGVENKIDADVIFKQAMKQRDRDREAAAKNGPPDGEI
ncbi:MAG: hypothetical protein LBN21_04325 [Treponema sp.]|jgi:hypothetical protein|nr:hypothetical protein [Treponema sp.]